MRVELEYDEQLLANALESDATGAFIHLDQTLFLASIAVSMKRIADTLGSMVAEDDFPPAVDHTAPVPPVPPVGICPTCQQPVASCDCLPFWGDDDDQ